MTSTGLETLDGARITLHDEDRGVLFVWFGGHGVHGYVQNADGTLSEALFWNCGTFANNDASEAEVRESIREHMEMGDEEYWSFC